MTEESQGPAEGAGEPREGEEPPMPILTGSVRKMMRIPEMERLLGEPIGMSLSR